MEKAEKIDKRKAPPAADIDGPRKKAGEKEKEVDEDEVEEFFAILRRMHGAVKYFEKASGDSRKWGPATWRAGLEAGVDLAAVDGGTPLMAVDAPAVEPRSERDATVLDLNVSPEESHGSD